MFDGVLSRLLASARQGKEPRADRFVPYRRHVTPGVVECEGGTLLAMYRLDGLSLELDTDAEIEAQHLLLNERFKALADPRRGLLVHVVKSETSQAEYPAGECRSDFGRRFNAAYRETLWDAAAPQRRIDLYLSLLVAPAERANDGGRARMALQRRKSESKETEAARLRALEDYCSQAEAQLADYGPTRLALRQVGRRLFTEIGEALHHVLYNERLPIALPRGPLAHAIYASRITVGQDTTALHLPGGIHYAVTFGPRIPSASSWPTAFRRLLRADYRFCMTHSFRFWPMPTAHSRMTLRLNQAITAHDPAASQTDLLHDFADRLQNGEFAAGDSHFSLTVYAPDAGQPDRLRQVNKAAARARADLAESGMNAAREDLALTNAFYGQLPGNDHHRTRPGLSTTLNLAADAPLDAPPKGAARGLWGEPILLLRTRENTSFRFHLHAPRAIGEDGDLGNTLVIGPAGSGKTVLLGALVAQAERLDAQVVLFDKDRGLETLVRAVGGTYLRLRPEDMGTAPLRARANTPRARTFLPELLRGMVMQDGGPQPTPDEERQLHLGLQTLLAGPVEARGLEELAAFLGVSNRTGLGARLGRWCAGGPLGWVADNPEDRIRLDAEVVGFDMTEILDHPAARGPVMADLFDRIEGILGSRRVLLVIDEFWKALLDPAFAPLVNDKLKTIRKRNGAVVLATQSIRDVLASPIAHTVLEQCPTQVWMANPRAPEADHVGHGSAGLTTAQFEAVKRGAVRDRSFLIRQQETAVMARLPLDRMGWALNVISGRAATLPLLERLLAEHGEHPAGWLDRFIAQAPAALAASRSNA